MHTLQIVADGAPGGGTTNVLALTEDLIAAGDTVSFCSQQNSYAVSSAESLGATVHDDVDFFRGRLDKKVADSIARVVQKVSPDVVHVHGGRAGLAFVRSAIRRFSGATVYTVRGYHFLRKRIGLRHLAALAERQISHRVGRTVHVCHYDQRLARRWGLLPRQRDSSVIHNGIRIADIPPVLRSSSRKSVAVLGRVTYQKNPHLVLDIARRLADEGYQFELIGGGDMEAEIHQRVAQQRITNVTLHGSLSRQDALKVMSHCGSFLLASRWEGLPIAPVEAMQMGLAVVVSRVSGNIEVVDHGVDGQCVDSEDREGYVRALRCCAERQDQTDQMIERAKAKVVKSFSRQRVVEQYRQVYQQLMQSAAA